MDVKDFVKIRTKRIDKTSIVITEKTRLWCKLPYKGYPNGCPNSGKPTCTNAPKFDTSKYKYFYLVYADFDFEWYKKEKATLPQWKGAGDKALGNSRHWESRIKKLLKDKITQLYKSNTTKDFHILGSGSGFTNKEMRKIQEFIYSMEASCIYVFKTLENNDISHQMKPKTKIKIVSLICSDVELKFKKKLGIDTFLK